VRVNKVVKFISQQKSQGGTVLDIGYAKNCFSDKLKKLGWKCFAMDICPRKADGIKFVKADANEGIPLKMKFDVITAGELIEHIIDDERFLRQCRNHLNPDGILVLTTPNLTYLLNRILMFFGRLPLMVYAPFHYHIYTLSALKEKLDMNGFDVVKVQSSHILFSTRTHPVGAVFEFLGNIIPTFGAHLIIYAKKRKLADDV
jgi:2-polyprenyl-3-methyl-5-hydroxy-6-metoxy-1,4-benzoquinol methylase